MSDPRTASLVFPVPLDGIRSREQIVVNKIHRLDQAMTGELTKDRDGGQAAQTDPPAALSLPDQPSAAKRR
jgi:hypothetical protein